MTSKMTSANSGKFGRKNFSISAQHSFQIYSNRFVPNRVFQYSNLLEENVVTFDAKPGLL